MTRLLPTVHEVVGTDILLLTDPTGKVLCRAANPAAWGDDLSDNPIIRETRRTGTTVAGTALTPQEELLREGETLAARALFRILPTPAARPSALQISTTGMAVGAAVPLWNDQGALAGILYGANLLNRRFELVDRIKAEVFQGQTHQGKEIGTATIFQGDLRISTNVMTGAGKRALGTRLSEAVYERVIEAGEVWADRAFVVNDWYITAYEPIRDPSGAIIGSLYVGLLEAPYTQPQRRFLTLFLAVMALTTVVSLVLFFLVTKAILMPVARIVRMSRRVIGGDLSARMSIRPPGEMGILCQAIDSMADAVQDREEKLKQATRQQIGRSEQLASVGRLAAGIAHEVNNPLTGVLTFSHLLKEKPHLTEADRQDLDVIIQETTRVREIVRGLLDFARERPADKQRLDINDVLRRTLQLIRSQREFRVEVVEDYAADLPLVPGDRNQLQQVFLNLALNACEAMAGAGRLRVSTAETEEGVAVRFEDTGCGIDPADIEQIFEPFYTTKEPGKGTGLGLSVSYGIVRRHDGGIKVESRPGLGSTFTVLLPTAGELPPGEEQDGDGRY